VPARAWGFKSPLRHRAKALLSGSVGDDRLGRRQVGGGRQTTLHHSYTTTGRGLRVAYATGSMGNSGPFPPRAAHMPNCLQHPVVMNQPGEERWAQRVISRELRLSVEQHDDGTEHRMYDLRVGPATSPTHAIEVTSAAWEEFMATMKTLVTQAMIVPGLVGDWVVSVVPTARPRDIKKRVPDLLRALEAIGRDDAFGGLQVTNPEHLDRVAGSIGVTHANRYREQGRGQVHFTTSGGGGAVHYSGTALPGFVSEFTKHPKRANKLINLARSEAPECHLFVVMVLGGTPWPVESFFTVPGERTLPAEPPDLPKPLTAV
jgi:hypothetical protein